MRQSDLIALKKQPCVLGPTGPAGPTLNIVDGAALESIMAGKMLLTTDDSTVISSDILQLHSNDPTSPYYAGNNSFLVARGDVIPDTNNTYSLGSTGIRWKSVHVGPGSIYLQDTNNAGFDVELTVTDGVLLINNANQLQVGNLKFVDNSIESADPGIDITLGRTGSQGNFIVNRNMIMNETSISGVHDFGCTGQATFQICPHIMTEPTFGMDAATKGYVDSVRGQYGGNYSLFMNQSQTTDSNGNPLGGPYFLSPSVSSQTISPTLTTTVDSLDEDIASFKSDPLGVEVIPAGLFTAIIYGSVNTLVSPVSYFFTLARVDVGGTEYPIANPSSFSNVVNALTIDNNPVAFSCILLLSTPVTTALTDRLLLKIKARNITPLVPVNLTTFFENNYYSYLETTLNAGTTLLTSNNTWEGVNSFHAHLEIVNKGLLLSSDPGATGQVLTSHGLSSAPVWSDKASGPTGNTGPIGPTGTNGVLGITGPTGNILYSLGATGFTFSHYGMGYSNSLVLATKPTAVTTLPAWSTLATTYIIFIDDGSSDNTPNVDPFRHIFFADLSASSGSEYQTVFVINCSSRNWEVYSNTANINGNTTAPVNMIIVPHAPDNRSNSLTFRSFKNGANYEWIVH